MTNVEVTVAARAAGAECSWVANGDGRADTESPQELATIGGPVAGRHAAGGVMRRVKAASRTAAAGAS
jgi:hypothetical protein